MDFGACAMNTRSTVQRLTGVSLALLAWVSFAQAQTPRLVQQRAISEFATVSFDTNSLAQIYSGSPCPVLATTEPAGLAVEILYEGQTNAPTDAGYYEVIATVTESNWTGGATNYLSIDRAPQTVLFGLPDTILATSTVPLSAVSSSGQIPTIGVISGPGVIQGQTLFFTNQGECVVAACVNGNENWRDACTLATVQVSLATADITLYNMTQPYDGTPIAPLVETVPEFLSVEILYNGSAQAPVNVGSYSVEVRVTDPQWYGETSGLLTIIRGEQRILFTNPGVCARTSTPELVAGSSALLPTDFTVVEGPASIQTNNARYFASFTQTGRVSIAASQSGTSNWLPAPTVTQTFLVFENPIQIQVTNDVVVYDGSPHAVQLFFPNGSGLTSNDFAVTYSGSIAPPTNAGNYDLVALITNPPSLQGGYIGAFTILKADDDITFDAPEEVIATQRITLAATSLSQRPCAFYAEPTQVARVEDQSNLVFLAAGDALVCAYVNDGPNWNGTEEWVWVTATKADTIVNLVDLFQPFDGTPRIVSGYADVPSVEITYDGSLDPPVAAGRYAISGILSHPIYQGSATGTLIVLERPEISMASSNGTLQLLWPAEPGVRYAVQQAASPLDPWNALPPFTNLTGNGSLSVEIPATNTAHFRIISFP